MNIIPQNSHLSVPLPSDLIEKFILDLDIKQNSKSTYRRQIKPFFLWLLSKYNMANIGLVTHQDICQYKHDLLANGKSAYTVSGYLTVVRKFFEWLECNKIFPNIAKNVKGLKKPKGFRKDCLTISQIHETLAIFDLDTLEGLRNFAIFNLLVRTGLRSIEVARALVGDLRQNCGAAILQVQGKGRDLKDDFVLLVEDCLKPIRRYLSKRGQLHERMPLFASISNRTADEPLKERSIRWIIKEALKKIEINDPRISTHSLRHTAVSLSVKNGASLIQVQAMARHADPKTTMIYFHNEDRIKSGAEKLVIF